MAITATAELIMVHPGGLLSDKFGRKWAAMPSLLLLSLSLVLLPYCHTFYAMAAFALFSGMANGLGGGVIMTLGLDLAPKDQRGTFLGLWRLLADISGTLSPLLIGLGGKVLSIASTAVLGGSFGLLAGVLLSFKLKETLIKKDQSAPQTNQDQRS